MNSSFLCVIVTGLLFEVFAQDRFHSKLWWKNLQKINEEIADQFDSKLWRNSLEELNEEKNDRFAFQILRKNLQKQNEENKKRKTYELAAVLASNTFVGLNRPPRKTAEKTKSYLVCAEKTGVGSDTILRIKGGDWTDDDHIAKAWVQCVLMENNLMTDQSVFRQHVAFQFLSGVERQSLEENIDKCLPDKPLPPVEISWKFAKCFQNVDPENSLF